MYTVNSDGQKLDRRVRYTRMVIVSNFVKLLHEKPLPKITVKEICELADINRATFYKHYADPYDLLLQIEQELTADISRYLDGMQYSNLGSVSVDLLAGIFGYIRENAQLCSVLLSDSLNLEFRRKIVDFVQQQCVAAWSKEMLIAPEKAEYTFTFAAYGSVGVIQKWLSDGMKKSDAEMAELISTLTTKGILYETVEE